MSITTVDIVDNSQCIYIYPQCKLICTWCFTWHGSRKNMGHLPASHNLPICHTSSENAQLRANTQLRIGLQMSLPIPETKHFRWLTESILNKLSLGTPRLLKHARMLFYPPWWHFGKPDGPWSWNIQRKQLLWCERKGTRFFFLYPPCGKLPFKNRGRDNLTLMGAQKSGGCRRQLQQQNSRSICSKQLPLGAIFFKKIQHCLECSDVWKETSWPNSYDGKGWWKEEASKQAPDFFSWRIFKIFKTKAHSWEEFIEEHSTALEPIHWSITTWIPRESFRSTSWRCQGVPDWVVQQT